MKTLLQIVEAIQNKSKQEAIEVLKWYCDQIVDTCAGNFECTMEWDGSMHPDGVVREYPVLMRGSILAVKNMIK